MKLTREESIKWLENFNRVLFCHEKYQTYSDADGTLTVREFDSVNLKAYLEKRNWNIQYPHFKYCSSACEIQFSGLDLPVKPTVRPAEAIYRGEDLLGFIHCDGNLWHVDVPGFAQPRKYNTREEAYTWLTK